MTTPDEPELFAAEFGWRLRMLHKRHPRLEWDPDFQRVVAMAEQVITADSALRDEVAFRDALAAGEWRADV